MKALSRETLLEMYNEVSEPHEGLIAVRKGVSYFHVRLDGVRPYIDVFLFVGDFYEGLARAQMPNGTWCHIDHAGKPAYPERYDGAGDFHEGVAWITIAFLDGPRKKSYIRPDGNRLSNVVFDEAGDFHEGRARVRSGNEEFHISQDLGSRFCTGSFDRTGHFQNGLAWVQRDDEQFHIDHQGNKVD